MSLLVIGVSHHTAPINVLEQMSAIDVDATLTDLGASDSLAEALMLSTCNRIEVYTEVSRFHAAVDFLTTSLAKSAGITAEELSKYLYVHYEEAAVRHAFRVTSGLDSMVTGDEQILGQFREAFKFAVDQGRAGRRLHELAQNALRVGKRVHTDTGIGRHGASIVEVALEQAAQHFGSLEGREVVIVGTGSMSSLAASVSAAQGARVTIVGRTPASVTRLAQATQGRGLGMDLLADAVKQADVLVTATGATGLLITADDLVAWRAEVDGDLFICDLALPHDTDPSAGTLPGITRLDLPGIAELPQAHVAAEAQGEAESIVMDSVLEFVQKQTSAKVEPVVVALRARAESVVVEELDRLRMRNPELSDEQFAEIARSMRRVVAALLHTPTVRMKELAVDPGGDRYAAALHALFDLDPSAVQALSDSPSGAQGA